MITLLHESHIPRLNHSTNHHMVPHPPHLIRHSQDWMEREGRQVNRRISDAAVLSSGATVSILSEEGTTRNQSEELEVSLRSGLGDGRISNS